MANPLLDLIKGYNELRETEEQKGKAVETKGSEEVKDETKESETQDTEQKDVDEKDVENLSVEEKVDVLAQAVSDLTAMMKEMKEGKDEKEGAE